MIPFGTRCVCQARDPKQSFATGLLAWAAKDIPAMTSQWRQTLQTSAVYADIMLRLSRMRLTDEQVIEQLMPDRWYIPLSTRTGPQ